MRDRTTSTVDARGYSDADLTTHVRSGPPAAGEAALDELYRRHRGAVLAYARTCTRDLHTAEDLASEAFARALQAIRGGSGPAEAWRPYLLTTVRHTAAAWALTARRTELAPDFDLWLSESSIALDGEERALRGEEADRAVRAFRRLPDRWQTALWHSAVEGESPKQIAPLLGLSASGTASLTARAREGLREAYLAEYVTDATASPECRHYVGLMAASVRSPHSRRSAHLERHLAVCARCRRAWMELRDLNRMLGIAVPAGVLLWTGGLSWLKTGATGAAASSTTVAGVGKVGTGSGMAVKAGVVSASLLAAVVGGYALLPDEGKQRETRPAPRSAVQVIAPTPVLPTSPATSSSMTPSTSLSTRSTPSPSPSWSPAATDRTLLRIAGTGRCMDIGKTVGSQPYETACNGNPTQQWDLIVDRTAGELRIRNHASGMCLMHTASESDGAPVRQQPDGCTSTSPTARWTYCLYPGQVAFAEKGLGLYRLGLNDWHTAESSSTHSSAIGTTANYYDTPSLRFLYVGGAFTG